MENEEYMVLDENGEVLARFKDVNSLYEFVKEKTKEGKKVRIQGPPNTFLLIVSGKIVGEFPSAEGAFKKAKEYIFREDVRIRTKTEEYMVFDENGKVVGKFKDVDSLYEFVKEKTEEGKRIKIKGPEEFIFYCEN